MGQRSSPPAPLSGYRFGRWLEVDPDLAARPALERACLLEQAGAVEEAIAVLSRALVADPGRASLYAARGALLVAAAYPRAGAADFQRAVDLAPGCAQSWFALGHANELLLLSQAALDAFQRASSLGDQESRLYLSMARVYRTLGRRGQAARSCELALTGVGPVPAAVLAEALAEARRLVGNQADPATEGAARDALDPRPAGVLDEGLGPLLAQLTAIQLADRETRDAACARLGEAEQDGGQPAAPLSVERDLALARLHRGDTGGAAERP